ncbi:MAG: hypothetical protein GY728_02705 [Phycisphaeraceae bacterium]|nr:hypothetical protein [Phycisphaeraceae bacterium]MCP4795844.1 hypothetical protein [Phycisphaeraceae bacterium]MCP4940058.1 hypothetical protein [Phycisphaeraceae bacterium]
MNLMNGSAQKAGALLVVASVTITAPSLAGVTYSTISVGPDTPGWYNQAGLTSTIAGGFDGTQSSLAASGTGKNQFYITGADLFGGSSLTLGDIASITYSTKKSGDAGSPDWFIQIYTDPYTDSPGSSWYGNRIQAEPYLASNIDAPAGEWNEWTTASGINSLNWGDSSENDFGANIGGWDALKSSSVLGGSGTYGEAGVQRFTFGTGSGWAEGFNGEIGPITVTFNNGTGTIIDFAASTPVPGPAGLTGLVGLAVVGRRRRR